MKKKISMVAILLVCLNLNSHCKDYAISTTNLRCELLDNPLGIDIKNPHLSWEIKSEQKSLLQLKYHILVASSLENLNQNIGDLWDTQEVESNLNTFIKYDGKSLRSRDVCYWKVKIITNRGASDWSQPSFWTMGLMNTTDWVAKWVGLDKSFEWEAPEAHNTRVSARYLRKEFESEEKPTKATLYICSYGESFMFNNYNLYKKWANDIKLTQKENGSISDIAPSYWSQYTDNMTWPGTYLTVVDMLYKQYGDTDIIHEHYGFMKKWLYYMRDRYRTDDYVMPRDQYGDWCPPPNNPFLNDPTDSTLITDQKLIGTAYYYYMLHLLEKFANILDLQDDAEILKSESIKVKNAYNKKFLNSESGYYSNSATTANILSLSFDLVPDDCKHKVYDNLKKRTINEFKGHVSSGIIGNQWLMRVFTQNGDPEIPFNMLLKTKYPSFGYMIEQGATTIWEHWNGNTMEKWIDSQNHVMQLGDLTQL